MESSTSLKDWEPILDKYTPKKMLGSGSYGQVVEAEDKATGRLVAIKRVPGLFEDLIDTKRVLREITLLRFMKNENIVELLDIVYDKRNPNFDTIFLIFECLKSDLKKIIKSNHHLTIEDVRILMYRILCGLKYIHSCSVLHRDLKPGNILLNDNYVVKICDFGLARCVNKEDEDEVIEEKVVDNHRGLDRDKLTGKGKYLNKYLGNKGGAQPAPDTGRSAETPVSNSTAPLTPMTGGPKRPPMLKDLKKKANQQVLSCHVVTRWYRAPELILIESDYTSAIDVWSVGCIFGELMMMLKENAPTFIDRTPLFPGKFCFPLSPPGSKKVRLNEHGFPNEKSDQLAVIFDVIGTPSEEDIQFISDENALLYLKSLKERPKKNLKNKFPGSPADSIDLLEKMLIFNPSRRIKVDEALEHPFFEEIRDPKKEVEAEFNLEFEFEGEVNLTMEKLRGYFIQVIKSYHKK
ncbi:MAG: mitogen-activated protein kinase [archaeon]|nr:mitogen-activated protein kinase [archaeon]